MKLWQLLALVFAADCIGGYLVGIWLSGGLISAQIANTEWGNLWTYTWILFGLHRLAGLVIGWVLTYVFVAFSTFMLVIAYLTLGKQDEKTD